MPCSCHIMIISPLGVSIISCFSLLSCFLSPQLIPPTVFFPLFLPLDPKSLFILPFFPFLFYFQSRSVSIRVKWLKQMQIQCLECCDAPSLILPPRTTIISDFWFRCLNPLSASGQNIRSYLIRVYDLSKIRNSSS